MSLVLLFNLSQIVFLKFKIHQFLKALVKIKELWFKQVFNNLLFKFQTHNFIIMQL